MRRATTDRAIGIALGILIGIVIVVAFVFLGSRDTIDDPSINEGGGGPPIETTVPGEPGAQEPAP